MPGGERLVSFQGENGNLTAPLWPFRHRGQSGKMTSDLLPRIGELADDICFLHSLTTKSNTHGPAENVMSTGFTVEGFPSMGAWLTYALGSENHDLPAFVAIEDPRGGPANGSEQLGQRVPAGRVPGNPIQYDQADPLARTAGRSLRRGRQGRPARAPSAQRSPRRPQPRRPGTRCEDRQL